MNARSAWLGAAGILGTVLLTGAAGLAMLAGSAGARSVVGRAPDAQALRLASVVEQRDELRQRVAELEARLRHAPPAVVTTSRRPATVAQRWTEPDAVGGIRLCARIVEVNETGAPRPTAIMLSELCGDLAPVRPPEDSISPLDSLLRDRLFACWMDAAPRSEAPPCLSALATERASWSDPVPR